MQKILLLISVLLFWGSCKSAPPLYSPTFEKFEVKKITEKGIESFSVLPNRKDWPDVQANPAENISFKADKIKIAVIGDTGCRLKETQYGGAIQNCSDIKEWPYPKVIQSLVKESFDFAIHTGDYHYREQCSNPKLCPTYTKSIGYTWATWWDDFYGPTQELFKKAPLLLVRGNHEDCKRAYSGWNPLSPLNKKFDEKCEDIEPYQWVEMQDLVFINFDDSAFEDRKASTPEERQKFLNILIDIEKRIAALNGKKEIWFLAHKPVFGYVPDKKKNLEPFSIDPYLQSIMLESKLMGRVDYILSGHIHNQQLVLNQESLRQIIVGHSGSALDPFAKRINSASMISSTESAYHYGYALFERQGFKKWKFIFKNQEGKADLECRLQDKNINCE